MSYNKYNNGKVYKIESEKGNKIYIGSTTKHFLSSRLERHISDYYDYKRGFTSKSMTSFILFDEYGVSACKIVLLENVNCDDKKTLLRCEAKHIRNNETVNKIIPLRTRKEYCQDNKEKIYEYIKLYNIENKEKINKRKNVKHVCNICNGSYTVKNRAQHNSTQMHLNKLNI